MIVVSAKDLTKAYGTDVILDKVSFHINQGDRVGIIGINGAGKTTLLRMLTGELSSEEGDIFVSGNLRLGYLKQDAGFDSEKTVIQEAQAVFSRFPEMEREMEQLLQQHPEAEMRWQDLLLKEQDQTQVLAVRQHRLPQQVQLSRQRSTSSRLPAFLNPEWAIRMQILPRY